MECDRCSTSLSIQDVISNQWIDESEIFTIKCPQCSSESQIISPTFEAGHISIQYLAMIVTDSKEAKSEKYVNYLPIDVRNKIFEHLSKCKKCSDRVESLRLTEISNELKFSEKLYDYFVSKADDIIQELDPKKNQIKTNGSGVHWFVHNDNMYKVAQVFFRNSGLIEGIEFQRTCYNLESDNLTIGMVSFIESNNKIILEKIWFKSEERLELEKQFVSQLQNGKIKLVFDLLHRLHNFV
jgi:hypothetical protein